MTRQRILSLAVAALSVALVSATASAQHMGHGSGMPATTDMHGGQHAMGANDQMMRNVGATMASIESTMRQMASDGGQHGALMAGMTGMLDQMRAVHGQLVTMQKDPTLMHDANATKAFGQACRDLDRMATSFQSMIRNVQQSVKH